MMAEDRAETQVERLLNLPPVYSLIPGAPAVELVSYYPRFREYYRACEPQTKRWFVEKTCSDWRIFDVGANIGYYSVLFSRLARNGHVWAFEPTDTFRMLKRNLAHANCANVTPMQVALGMAEGELVEDVYRLWGEDPERKTYNFKTVDRLTEDFRLDRLDCLKIDVDSFDLEVLKGSERTLEYYNPWIVVELNHALAKRNQSVADALEWLTLQGYTEAMVLDGENYVLQRGIQTRKLQFLQPSLSLVFDSRPVILDEFLVKDRPLEGLLLQKPRLHNDASVEELEVGIWRVVVPGPAWSYALSWPRTESTGKNATSLILYVDLLVSAAAVGVGCVNRDMKAFVSPEQIIEPSAAIRTVEIEVDDGSSMGHLMLRNADPEGTSAIVEVLEIRAFAAIPGRRSQPPLFAPKKRRLSLQEIEGALKGKEPSPVDPPTDLPGLEIVPIEELGLALGFDRPCLPAWRAMPHRLPFFHMELDEASNFSYIYANHRPERHLEFGTWEGLGVVLCARACDARIWTINLPQGEVDREGQPVYIDSVSQKDMPEELRRRLRAGEQTDAADFIGWRYRAEGYEKRVTQILCDSRKFDETIFPQGFFDSVLIDGGHSVELVTNDTDKALKLLRSGGLMIWHDFCPDVETLTLMDAPRGVVQAVLDNWDRWRPAFTRMFWIRPSWTLIGVRA